ncbi:hypothetical protein [Rickettsiella endosymbiont of Aleochara curtula]|uniref:hypothetical protein n=1 Tax=Rickettsiella endosymbiont of Aleochara curtula TaxID=3077936 RepID=UPI00313AF4F6
MTTILSVAEIHDLQGNLKLRGKSFKAGMLLMVDALKNLKVKKIDDNKEKSQLIDKYIGTIVCIDEFYEKKYELKLDDIISHEEGNQNLSELLSKYTQLVQANIPLKDSFQSLCEAERYAVWEKGRKVLETAGESSQFEVIGVTVKSSQLKITQQEIPCQDVETLAEEYKKIDNKTPPFWFQWLSLWQQEFIGKNRNTLIKNSIPSSLRSVPGLANLSKHVCTINGVERLAYFRHATQRPVDLMNNKDAHDEGYRITCLNMASQIRLSLEDQIKRAGVKQMGEAVILTQSLLSPGTVADLKSKISGPSDNDTEIYKMKEEIVELFQYALSHPNEAINEKHVQLKALFLSEYTEEQPIFYKDFLAKWGLEAQRGLFKYKDSEPLKITLLSTNHPLNILRRGGVYTPQTSNNDYNTALLLGVVGRFLMPMVEEHSEKIHLTQQLPTFNQLLKTLSKCEEEKTVSINDKQNLIETLDSLLGIHHKLKLQPNILLLFHAIYMLLSTPINQGGLIDEDMRHNQLLISSAEAIILNCIQGSLWVACKSGKDRTGIASIAYDAALLYFMQSGKLPGHKDGQSARDAYISLLKSLFDSGHQQKAAGENAPGAKGIVEPGMILPADVKIDKWTNTTSTFFARLNKPSDPDGRKIRVPLFSLKNLTKRLFFKPEKELIQEIEIPMTNIFRSS